MDKRKEKLMVSISEARRFIDRAEKAVIVIQDQTRQGYRYQCAEYATAKRSSMDLTRSLADLRKAG